MSQDKTLTPSAIALRVLGAAVVVCVAGVLGGLLGRLSAPNLLPPETTADLPEPGDEADDALAEEAVPVVPALDPPLYLHLGIGEESVWEAIEQEVDFARESGLHQYIVPLSLAWGDGANLTASLENLNRVLARDADANFLLQLNLNPPEAWFAEHPDAQMAGVAGDVVLPTPASGTWLNACRENFDQLLAQLRASESGQAVSGFVLEGLQQGDWRSGDTIDTSADNLVGFRNWLMRNYVDDAALRKAWGQDDATLEEAALPNAPEQTTDVAPAFLDLKEDGPRIDYARYRAASVADAIGAMASHIRETAGSGVTIWANYGYVFEMADSASGHLGLGLLLESDLDGFVAPVSLANRGLGGTGGYMGPVHSALDHGKQWIIVDDARTGMAWNDETGSIEQIRGLRPEDVHNVQRRNFALAALQGLGLAWSDPNGRGALSSESQWAFFQELQDIYRNHIDYPGSRLAIARQTYPEDAPVPQDPTLLVVIDEASQFLTNDAAGLSALLAKNRDEILRAGVTTEFCLLDDLLDARTSRADIYLFLNAYDLPSSDRDVLHERFAAEGATAIWVYAPGYKDVTLISQNISDTVAMNVKAFDEPTGTGSVYTLGGGHWLEEGQTIGTARAVAPLFYVDDEETDVLAKFKQSEKPSLAMRTLESGWTSIYFADPELTAPMLRELFRILEQQVHFRPGKQRFFDVMVAHQNLLAIHAGQVGERIVNLGQFYDIQDLFDESIGWPQKESFVLNMEQGETRLLQLNPL